MKKRTWRWILVLMLTTSYLIYGYTVPIGATRDEVIAAYGYPASQAKTGDRELLNYKEGAVVLENGRVAEFRFTKGEPRSLKRAPQPVYSPPPRQPLPAPRAVESAPPSAPYAQPGMNRGIGLWMALMPALALVVIVAALKKLLRRRPQAWSANKPATFSDVVTRAVRAASPAPMQAGITRLSRESLDRLEWRRFEELVHGYFGTQGWTAQRSRVGADGGIDIFLYRPGQPKPGACVQCKAWRTYTVGVKPVRELLGVMAANQISEGYFVATGGYTAEATSFAEGKPLYLISGANLLERFAALPEADHKRIVSHAFRGDYETPTCPSCDEKMVRREADEPFWGCRNYPRCRRTFKLRE